MLKYLIIACLIVLGCEGLGTAGGESKSPETPSARELVKEYDANPVAWNEKYRGKILFVSGRVRQIKEGGNVLLDAGELEYVELTFASQWEDHILELETGKTATFQCIGVEGEPTFFTVVRLSTCKLHRPRS